MLINLMNWCWILFSTLVTGTFIISLIEKLFKYRVKDWEAVFVSGMVFVTLYAETFSLFYRVGRLATLCLLLICLGVCILYRKMLIGYIRYLAGSVGHGMKFRYMLVFMVGIFFLMISSCQPYLGDTYLYHVQAIEWIEKYGVVKGLGNLHFRLAYNSAFESLSALYSWSSIVGQSLHAVNGFYGFLMVAYCILSFRYKAGKKVYISDLLRLVTVYYIFGRLYSYGAPDTDPLVMSCVAYIFIKGFDLAERQEKSCVPYGLLSILGMFACTLKLSAGLIILLAVLPVYQLVRVKEWNKLGVFVLMGLMVTLPYLIRNVLISGYLLYPYTAMDLFHVDWKMPASVARMDRDGIVLWGRGLQNVEDANALKWSIEQWLPIWFKGLSSVNQMLFVTDLVGGIGTIILFIYRGIKKNKYSVEDFLVIMSLICFGFWMVSAPLERYGSLYMLIVLACIVGEWCYHISPSCMRIMVMIVGIEIVSAVNGYATSDCGLIVPADYREDFWVEGHETSIQYADGSPVTIYTVKEDSHEMSNYNNFPETPYQGYLDNLEFRGDRLEDGFRSKLNQ